MRMLLTLAIIAVAVYLIYSYFKRIYDRTSIKIARKGIDLGGVPVTTFLSNLLLGQMASVKIIIEAILTNGSSFPVRFNNFRIKLFSEGILIGQSTDVFYQKKFTVPADGQLSLSDSIDVFINPASIKLLTKTLTNQQPEITYEVRVNIFFIPFSFTGTFNS